MILRHYNRQPRNNLTERRIKETEKELLQKTGVCITINNIWINNEKRVISPKINDFLWKLCYNRHKVRTWFLKIRGQKNKAYCKCRKLKTIDHIIMECLLNQGPTIQNYIENKWKQTFPKTQWLQPTIKLIRELGSIQLKESPKWMSEAYIEKITKAIQQIQTIKNNQIFNKKEIPKELAIRILYKLRKKENGSISQK